MRLYSDGLKTAPMEFCVGWLRQFSVRCRAARRSDAIEGRQTE